MDAALTLASTIESLLGPLPERLRAALLRVDRSRFVREVNRDLAYENLALPLDTPASPAAAPVAQLIQTHGSWLAAALQPEYTASGATISQPLMYMLAFKLLELDEGDHYLELVTGTGYGAALAAEVVGASGLVTTVDVDASLLMRARELLGAASRVRLVHDDGLARPDLLAAHDACWITFAIPNVPATLRAALRPNARMLAPG